MNAVGKRRRQAKVATLERRQRDRVGGWRWVDRKSDGARETKRQLEQEDEKARGFETVDDVGRGWRRKGNRNDDQYLATPRATTYSAEAKLHLSNHFVSRSRMEHHPLYCIYRNYSVTLVFQSSHDSDTSIVKTNANGSFAFERMVIRPWFRHIDKESYFLMYLLWSFVRNVKSTNVVFNFSVCRRKKFKNGAKRSCMRRNAIKKQLGTHDPVPRGHDTGMCENHKMAARYGQTQTHSCLCIFYFFNNFYNILIITYFLKYRQWRRNLIGYIILYLFYMLYSNFIERNLRVFGLNFENLWVSIDRFTIERLPRRMPVM